MNPNIFSKISRVNLDAPQSEKKRISESKYFLKFSNLLFMLISLQKSCRGQISTTIELEKSFPGDHFAEKIILTTDFSGIINTKFPQGLI